MGRTGRLSPTPTSGPRYAGCCCGRISATASAAWGASGLGTSPGNGWSSSMSASTKRSCGGPRRRRPDKVVYPQATPEDRGTERSLLRMVQGLDRTRFRPHVIMPAAGPMVGPLQELDCRVLIVKEMRKLTTRRGKFYLLAYALNYPRAVWKLVRVIRGLRIDL